LWHIYQHFIGQAEGELYRRREDIDAELETAAYRERMRNGEIGNNLLYNAKGYTHAHDYRVLSRHVIVMAGAFVAERLGARPDVAAYLEDLRSYIDFKRGFWLNQEQEDNVQLPRDFVAAAADGWRSIPSIKPTLHHFAYEQWQRELWIGQFLKYGTGQVGLGKIVARTPLTKADRQVTHAR
jgi:hypothetical protein